MQKNLMMVAMLLLGSPGFVWGAETEIVFEEGIEFPEVDGQILKLNLARPKEAEGPLPAVVLIHGGGWLSGERGRWSDACKDLASRGFVAVTLDYRLCPAYRWPAQIHDVEAGVRWLRANAEAYGVDVNRIGCLGDSAGGQLALMLALTSDYAGYEGDGGNADHSSAVSCAVSLYGPSDLTRSYEASVDAAEVLPKFLGGNLQEARKAHIMASPLYWVTPDDAPVLILQGTEDPYVNHDHAVWLYSRLCAAEVDAQLVTLAGAGHGFRGEDWERAEAAMYAFLDKHLKGEED